jgi:DNA-binding NtrC family response regulator
MKEKILVIDHEKDNRTILEAILKKEKYEVRSTPDGKKAMDLIKSEHFDLIIIDIRVPGINRLEAVSQIKKWDDSIEVIVLTGYATIENAVKSLRDNGASDFLTKPLESTDELINNVKIALRRREMNQEKRSLFNRVKEITEELHSILSRLSGYVSK